MKSRYVIMRPELPKWSKTVVKLAEHQHNLGGKVVHWCWLAPLLWLVLQSSPQSPSISSLPRRPVNPHLLLCLSVALIHWVGRKSREREKKKRVRDLCLELLWQKTNMAELTVFPNLRCGDHFRLIQEGVLCGLWGETFLPLTLLQALHLSMQTQGLFWALKAIGRQLHSLRQELLLESGANRLLFFGFFFFFPFPQGELLLISCIQRRKLLQNPLRAWHIQLAQPYGQGKKGHKLPPRPPFWWLSALDRFYWTSMAICLSFCERLLLHCLEDILERWKERCYSHFIGKSDFIYIGEIKKKSLKGFRTMYGWTNS